MKRACGLLKAGDFALHLNRHICVYWQFLPLCQILDVPSGKITKCNCIHLSGMKTLKTSIPKLLAAAALVGGLSSTGGRTYAFTQNGGNYTQTLLGSYVVGQTYQLELIAGTRSKTGGVWTSPLPVL